MAQSHIWMLFVLSLVCNLGLWSFGGWLVVQGERPVGILLFIGAAIHSWLMWESFSLGSEPNDGYYDA